MRSSRSLLRAIELAALAWLAGITGCAERLTMDSGLVRRLNNRGPVILSPDNPYIAGNLLLAKEMEKSEELRGFVKHRGAPAALEVEKTTFAPLIMSLYYPEKGERYVAEQTDDGGWFIKGPEAIEQAKLAEVQSAAAPSTGSQPIALPPAELTGGSAPAAEPSRTDISPEPSAPLEEPARAGGVKSLDLEEDDKAKAEITPKGDLVHYVTYQGESLALIAEWYTDDIANAGKLARMNSISQSNSLAIGDTIVIPSYMVKNKNQLPEIAVDYARQNPGNYLTGEAPESGHTPPEPRFTAPASDVE